MSDTEEYEDVTGHCALGVLEVASMELGQGVRTRQLAERALQVAIQNWSIPTWNDFKATDVSEVVDKIRATAKDIRNSVNG